MSDRFWDSSVPNPHARSIVVTHQETISAQIAGEIGREPYHSAIRPAPQEGSSAAMISRCTAGVVCGKDVSGAV
jgi:hypothetical protein